MARQPGVYLSKRIKTIIGIVDIPTAGTLPETLHSLRVELKKVRAYLYLMEFCLPQVRQKDFFKPLEGLFKKAGKVRNLQLEEKWLQQEGEHCSVHYADLLRKLLEAAGKKLFQLLTDKKLLHSLNRLLKRIDKIKGSFKKRCLQQYELDLRNKIIALLHAQYEVEAYHQLRKQLKTLLYNYKFLPKAEDGFSPDYLDNLQDLLGNWHDAVIMSTRFHKAASYPGLPKEEKENLEKVAVQFDLTSRRLLEDCNKKIAQ